MTIAGEFDHVVLVGISVVLLGLRHQSQADITPCMIIRSPADLQ